MPEYFLILVLLFLVTLFLYIYFKVRLFISPKHLFATYTAIFFVGIIWDNFAIWRGHWSFGEQYLLGPRILFMPIEEYGFAIVTVYLVLVLYKIFEKKSGKR